MSTAFDPQSDGQMERINQVIKTYSHSDYNYEQNDCASMLAMAEYIYNNPKHSSTKISPFYENYRFQACKNWPTEFQFQNPASGLYRHYLTSVHQKLCK